MWGTFGEEGKCVRSLVGKPVGNKPLGRPNRGCEDIRMDLKVIRWEGVDWIHLALGMGSWRALVKMVMDLLVPYSGQNFLDV